MSRKPRQAEPESPRIQVVPLADLSPDAANARRHPERNRAAIAASLRQFGAARSIVLDAKGIVRAGNGTVEAAQAEGYTEVLVVEPEDGQIVAVRRRDWSPAEATAYAIADNRTGELAEWDEAALARTLEAISSEAGIDRQAVGFSESEVAALLDRLAEEAAGGDVVEDPHGEWKGMPECSSEDQGPFRTLQVHFADADAVQRFAEAIGQPVPDKAPYLWFPARKPVRWSEQPYVDGP